MEFAHIDFHVDNDLASWHAEMELDRVFEQAHRVRLVGPRRLIDHPG